MRFRAAASVLAFAVACVAGCGSGPSKAERVGSNASSIQGGSDDTTHNFAVAVCGASGGPMGGYNCQVICSGALIAPNLVISARHCVDSVSSATIDCAVDSFGGPLAPASDFFVTTDANMYDPSATWYSVAQIVTPTSTGFCGNDLSLLILGSNVPSSAVPSFATPEIWYPVYAPQFSTNLTAIGYGVDAPTDTASAGVRRLLENVPIDCVPGDDNPKNACAPVADSGIAANEFEGGNGLCEGDSGSSAFEQTAFNAGNPLSLGVLSRGGTSGNACQGSVYTQLYPWQGLIVRTAKQAAMLGHYAAPAWTTPPTTGDAGTKPPSDSGAPKDSGKEGGKPPGHRGTPGEGGTESTKSGQSGGCGVARTEPHGSGWVLALGLGAVLARRRRRT